MDALLRDGVELRRFYAAAPVCSPTRASVLTGRHPARMGIDGANVGHLPAEEFHLGDPRRRGMAHRVLREVAPGDPDPRRRGFEQGGRPKHDAHHSPPWEHGFDACFATEAKVPTFDPMIDPNSGGAYGTRYWTGPAAMVNPDDLDGDDSASIVARALKFIERCMAEGRPSLTVVWLHAPHEPVTQAPRPWRGSRWTPRPRDRYVACSLTWITGRALRAALEARGRGVIWYCSDNGPEHGTGPGSTARATQARPVRGRHPGSRRALVVQDAARPPSSAGPSTAPRAPWTSSHGPRSRGRRRLPASAGREVPVRPGEAQPYGFRTRRQRADPRGVEDPLERPRRVLNTLHHLARDPAEARDLAKEEPERLERMARAFAAWERDVIADRAIPGPR